MKGWLKWLFRRFFNIKVEQVYRCRRQKIHFEEKERNFGKSKLVSKALSSFTVLGLKLGWLSQQTEVVKFVAQKWLDMRISVALLKQPLRTPLCNSPPGINLIRG